MAIKMIFWWHLCEATYCLRGSMQYSVHIMCTFVTLLLKYWLVRTMCNKLKIWGDVFNGGFWNVVVVMTVSPEVIMRGRVLAVWRSLCSLSFFRSQGGNIALVWIL